MSKFETKKALQKTASRGFSELPKSMPEIPEDFVRKFPELAEYNRQVQDFWHNLQLTLVRYDERLTDAEATIAENHP